jgi:hypothetical protein
LKFFSLRFQKRHFVWYPTVQVGHCFSLVELRHVSFVMGVQRDPTNNINKQLHDGVFPKKEVATKMLC